MKKVLFLALFALFAACTAKLPVVSSADVTRGQALYPGYTLEQLQAGEMIFKQNCGK